MRHNGRERGIGGATIRPGCKAIIDHFNEVVFGTAVLFGTLIKGKWVFDFQREGLLNAVFRVQQTKGIGYVKD